MSTLDSPDNLTIEPGEVVVLEAPRVEAREPELRRWVKTLDGPATGVRVLDCDAGKTGLWAGLAQWIEEIFPAMHARSPELVDRHAHELVNVVPRLRRSIRSTMTTLTDKSQADESVRNYAIDRGYRIGQGVVEMLESWQKVQGDERWVVVCLDYDRAGVLVRRFFGELARRRAEALGLTLVLVVEPGRGDAVASSLRAAGTNPRREAWNLPGGPPAPPNGAEMRARAEELERQVAKDQLEIEIHLGELIHLWAASDRPDGALRWRALGLGMYNHYGFYEDAMQFVDPVLEHLETIPPIEGYEYFFTRWNLVGSLFGCLVANGHPDRAMEVIRQNAVGKMTTDEDRIRVAYVLAMLHARFLDEKDLATAEAYLQEGLDLLAETEELDQKNQVFLTVFLNNGLAFVRHRQGRPEEAIDLCRTGFEQMNRHLDPAQHRLHRSVLLYNQAQVYAALRQHADAIDLFGQALEMDPNYSEYYNERGNVYLSMGRFEDAIADYRRAIETSPPYPEVWTNLGQCYRQMGRLEEAVEAYSRALDLSPDNVLAVVGRAQALDRLERLDEAEAAYTRAIKLEPGDFQLWANRAVLRYQRDALEESLADLDRAVELKPEEGDLYQNRAVALESLGRGEDALRDLKTYLELVPDAPDRQAVEAKVVAASSAGAA